MSSWFNSTSIKLTTELEEGDSIPFLDAEKAHLSGALKRNGYPTAFVRAASQESKPRERDPEEAQGEGKPTLMMLPYVAGVSERIRKTCRNYNIKVVFRSGPTFRSMLTKVKDPPPCRESSERRIRDTMHVWKGLHRGDQKMPRN